MKAIQKIGLSIFIIGLTVFSSLLFIGEYTLSTAQFDSYVKSKGFKSELFINKVKSTVVEKEFSNSFSFSSAIISALENANITHKKIVNGIK